MSGHLRATWRSRVPRRRTLHLLVLLVPVAVLGVLLKIERIQTQPDGDGLLSGLGQLTSDVVFGAGWVLLWLWIAGRRRSRALGWATLLLAQLSTATLGVLTVIYHEFAQRTGSTLTWQRLRSTWENRAEFAGLLGSQLDPDVVTLLVAVLLQTILLPWLLAPLLSWALRTATSTPERAVAAERPPHRLRHTVTALLAVALLLSSLWTAPTASARFSRAPLTNLLMTPLEEANAFPVELDEAPPTPDPSATSLDDTSTGSRNVVVITLESQRASSVLPKTERPVTPVLDALAEQSLTAERGYAVVPHTSKSLTAVHCGVEPPLDAENSEAEPDGVAGRCLPDLLREQGYATGFFQSATEHFERRRDLTTNFGFDTVESIDTMPTAGFDRVNYFGYEDDVMLQPSREWLESVGGTPFMLSYLTVTAHHDYAMPADYPLIDFVDDVELNNYLNGLHYQDAFVGKVIDQLRDLGLYEDTVVVVVGDHGEGFAEHGTRQHDNTIHEEGIRVPLMVHDPQRTPEVVPGPVQQTAILPTVAELLGYRLSGTASLGQSMLSGEERRPVVTTCFERARCMTRITGDRKYIHHFGDRRDEVYDLATDPYELDDLATETDPQWLDAQREETLKWRLRVEQEYRELRGEPEPGESPAPR